MASRKETQLMVTRRTTLPVALVACLAAALPAGAQASSGAPAAHSAGDGAVPLTPAIVGQPLARAEKALDKAADAIDAGNGAGAVGPLAASRRYMIRAYRGARYLIANTPAAPVEEARQAATYRRLARRSIRAQRRGTLRASAFLKARASQDPDDAVGPTFADTPTAVFSVFTGQYDAATTAAGMLPDVRGTLLARTQTALNTAIILRNRLMKVVHNAAPPVPAEEAQIAQEEEPDDVATFDLVMPGVSLLIGDELQQMQGLQQDAGTPAASKTVLSNAIAANFQINAQLNLWWPPVPAED
jgi:hypothetical protein